MKRQEDQELKVRSWVFPFLGLALLLTLAFIPLNRSTPEEKVIRARSKAEILAYQIAQLYRESLAASADPLPTNNRGPASVRAPAAASPAESAPAEGLMGQDPWGHAYNYRIQPDSNGRLHVEMRSPGPNGQLEAEGGDDVVLILSF